MRPLLLLLALATSGCLDFREGLACASDDDCAGYRCTQGTCQAGSGPTGPSPDAGGHLLGAQVLAADQPNPIGLALDTARALWAIPRAATVDLLAVPKEGGTPALQASASCEQPASAQLATSAAGAVLACGSTLSILAPGASALRQLVVLDGGALQGGLAADEQQAFAALSNGHIGSTTLGGGALRELDLGPAPPNSLALDATHLYWASPGGVFRSARDGTGIETLDADGAAHISTDQRYVYWVTLAGANQGISYQPLTGGPVQRVPVHTTLQALAADGTFAYFAAAAVLRLPLEGGTSSPVSGPETTHPQAVAVDGDAVYWLDQTPHGALLRRPKSP